MNHSDSSHVNACHRILRRGPCVSTLGHVWGCVCILCRAKAANFYLEIILAFFDERDYRKYLLVVAKDNRYLTDIYSKDVCKNFNGTRNEL